MRILPKEMIRVLVPFAPLFSESVWRHSQVLLAGVILAPGSRAVSSALRAMGLDPGEALPPLPPGTEPREAVEHRSEFRFIDNQKPKI